MTRALRIVLAMCLALPLLTLAPGSRASAQSDRASYTDEELHAALVEADLVGEWIQASGISADAALVEVLGDGGYQSARETLLVELGQLAERRENIDDRTYQATALATDVDLLEELTRELRREVTANERSAALSLTPNTVAEAHNTLDSIAGERRWFGISLDPLVLAERRLVKARDSISRQVSGLSANETASNKTVDGTVAEFTRIHHDLQRVRSLIETTVQRFLAAEFEYAAHRSAVEATMADVHDLRLASPTSVGGLTVVTFDAYVRGARALDPACPVDWALLAGIGRVESRHGTIDNTVVQRSGQVSKPIFGPLLDGGATAREADAAVDAAVAAAEAEAALLQAEADAEREAEAAAQAALAALVWGEEEAAERAKQLEEQAAGDDAVGLAATPEPQVEEPKPRYDPLLWGDDLPFDEDDLPPLDDTDDIVIDDEEPQFRGNGFAVISDSDNGRLDRNSRWDRAVGPMQFIPETWSYWETDGNDDGTIDPQNLYDAAATAGQFLCHLSRTRGASPSSFVLGYNSSQTYVRNVLAVADAFAASELPTADG